MEPHDVSRGRKSVRRKILLETSYLVDYEEGLPAAEMVFANHDHEPLGASTISMFELTFGVEWGSDRALADLRDSLRWVDVLPFSVADAIEVARIQAELQSAGNAVTRPDPIVAANDHEPEGSLLAVGVGMNRRRSQ